MNLLPLTGQEKRLKELFLKNLDLQLDKPRYQPQFIEFPELREKIQQIIPSAFEEQFLELNCFETGQDVSVLTQMRYLPAVYHSHDFIEMLYAWHGECACYINGNELHLHNGDICLVAPGAVHAVAAVSDDAVIYIFQVRRSTFEQVFGTLLAEQSSLSDFLIKALYTDTRKNSVVFRTENVHDIRDCIARVYKEHNGENAHKKLMMNNLLESVLILLSRTPEFSAEIPVEQDVRADSKLVSILRHIHANYTRLSLSELAREFNYNERHISRMLKEHTGMNYISMVRQLRMNKAAELLSVPGMPIHDVAEQIGYKDVSSFVRLFRDYYGESPTDYRLKSIGTRYKKAPSNTEMNRMESFLK